MLVQIAGEGLGSAAGDRGVDKRIADAAEAQIEILSARCPVRTEHAEKIQLVLDSTPDRKAGMAVGERGVAGCGLGDVLLHLAKGAAGGGIEQSGPCRVAQPTAHRAEPGELLIDRRGVRAGAYAGEISAA